MLGLRGGGGGRGGCMVSGSSKGKNGEKNKAVIGELLS